MIITNVVLIYLIKCFRYNDSNFLRKKKLFSKISLNDKLLLCCYCLLIRNHLKNESISKAFQAISAASLRLSLD